MKICLINNLYKPHSRGGADRIVEIMCDGLRSQGHAVFVISTQAEKRSYQSEGNYYLWSNYARLGKMNRFFRAFFVLADLFCLKNYFRVKGILNKEKAELVITHNLRGLGFMAARAFVNRKHIHVLHDIQLIYPSGLMLFGQEKKISNFFTNIYFNLTRIIISSPDVVISPSAWLLTLHVTRGFFKSSKTKVMPNPAEIKKESFEKRTKGEIKKFLYVGEIENHKGVFLLLKAFQECQKYYEKISLDIIGKGSGLPNLPRIQGVSYLGWKSKSEVVSAIANSDCLIMPSLCYENSPTVMYEAATLGLPVIASRIGGATELAHHLGGVLFNAGDCRDLENKIIYSIKNPRVMESIGESSQQRVKKYSVFNYLKKITELL